ncbi:MAG: nitroreductase family protein [Muribaculaceae bacterium]|nr:nitroreductase family protein [Muribaculaceae bacterium]
MEKDNDSKDRERIIIENILTRTSDRLFDASKGVEDNKVGTILRAAMSAPTGVNRQPWHFYVVTDKSILLELSEALPYCKMAKDAGVAIVVCGDRRKFLEGVDDTLWVQDLSAASENILLAAHALGLGSVWTALYPHPDRMEKVKGMLGMEEEFVPFNVIPLGYVRTPHKPIDKWNSEAVTYIK